METAGSCVIYKVNRGELTSQVHRVCAAFLLQARKKNASYTNTTKKKSRNGKKKLDKKSLNCIENNESKNYTHDLVMTQILYADGGTLGQNGKSNGIYWSVYDENRGRPVVNRRTSETGNFTTNNEAEYLAFVECLRFLTEHGHKQATIRMDSQLVVSQISGKWKVNNDRLRYLCEQAQEKLRTLRSQGYRVQLEWVPRAELVKRLGH